MFVCNFDKTEKQLEFVMLMSRSWVVVCRLLHGQSMEVVQEVPERKRSLEDCSIAKRRGCRFVIDNNHRNFRGSHEVVNIVTKHAAITHNIFCDNRPRQSHASPYRTIATCYQHNSPARNCRAMALPRFLQTRESRLESKGALRHDP